MLCDPSFRIRETDKKLLQLFDKVDKVDKVDEVDYKGESTYPRPRWPSAFIDGIHWLGDQAAAVSRTQRRQSHAEGSMSVRTYVRLLSVIWSV